MFCLRQRAEATRDRIPGGAVSLPGHAGWVQCEFTSLCCCAYKLFMGALELCTAVQELLTSAQYVSLLAPRCFLAKGWSLLTAWRQGGWAAWQVPGHWRGEAGRLQEVKAWLLWEQIQWAQSSS